MVNLFGVRKHFSNMKNHPVTHELVKSDLYVCMCVCWIASVMSHSVRPHGLWPTRLLHPWDSPGKSIGVGCHFLLHGIFLTKGLNLRFFSSVQFSRSVVSDSLWPHGLQHTRPPCPSPTHSVYSNSCPLSQWCHPAISSSVTPFSSCPHSLPASESFLSFQ